MSGLTKHTAISVDSPEVIDVDSPVQPRTENREVIVIDTPPAVPPTKTKKKRPRSKAPGDPIGGPPLPPPKTKKKKPRRKAPVDPIEGPLVPPPKTKKKTPRRKAPVDPIEGPIEDLVEGPVDAPMEGPVDAPMEGPVDAPGKASDSDDSVIRESDSESEKKRKTTKNWRHKKNRTGKIWRTRREQMRAKFHTLIKKLKNTGKQARFEAAALNSFFCSGPGNECQVIGSQGAYTMLNRFFNHFNLTKEYSFLKEIREPGTPQDSVNGFIKILRFEKQGVNAYATLKCSLKDNADNLAFEYRVGQFINSIMGRFPCFVRTYNIYRVSESAWKRLTKPNLAPATLFPMLTEFPMDDVNEWCKDPHRIGIVTQYFRNTKSIHEWLSEESPETIFENLLQIFYQVYFVLSELHLVFTHYDLHPKNVLLYEIPNGRHVEFSYPNVQFRCRYIAKIIDYGRCYFKSPAGSSIDIYRKVREKDLAPECNKTKLDRCGNDKGLGLLRPGCGGPGEIPNYWHGISSDRKNESHDLRLLDNVLWGMFTTRPPHGRWYRHHEASLPPTIRKARNELFTISRNTRFVNTENGLDYDNEEEKKKKEGLGTREHLQCDKPPRGATGTAAKRLPICNVVAAEVALRSALQKCEHELNAVFTRPLYATLKCDGTSPVEFIRA